MTGAPLSLMPRRCELATAGGDEFKVALVRVLGDWQWTADTCHFQQRYDREAICHRCGATVHGETNYSNLRSDAKHWDTERSNAIYMASEAARLSPISMTPGFHVQGVWPELMHGGPLGLNLTVAGSVLFEFADEAAWAPRLDSGSFVEKLQNQLSAGFSEFKRWQSSSRIYCSQPRFTARRLCMGKKSNIPTLKAKAHNSSVVILWLEVEARKIHDRFPDNTYFRDRAAMLWGLAEFYRVCKRSGQWMSEQELADLQVARDSALFLFRKLSGVADEEGTPLYPFRPKLHIVDECNRIAQATGENPTSTWTFSDEDNMRVMTLIAQSCHGATLEYSCLEKWVLQFFSGAESDSD